MSSYRSDLTPIVRRGIGALLAVCILAVWLSGAITLDPRRLAKKSLRLAHRIEDSRTKWVDSSKEAPAYAYSAADQKRGFVVFQRSALMRLYVHSTPATDEASTTIRLQAAWNEYEPAQLGVRALRDLKNVRVEVSALADDRGNRLPASAFDVRMERFYALHLSIKAPNRLGVVPKTLEPAAAIAVDANTTRPYWVTVHVPDGQVGGVYHGTITVKDDATRQDVPLEVEVLPRRLDEPEAMLGPLSVSVLRNYPRVEGPEAEKVLARADLIFRDIREHGMTTLSLWSGNVVRPEKDDTVVLADLDAAIDLHRRYRFPQPLLYAPVNLLNTNKIGTSSNYKHYDPAIHVHLAATIARTYTRRAAEAGLPGIIFDPVEEPNFRLGVARTDPPDIRQRMATELLRAIKQAGGKTIMTCTPETARIGQGNLDYWLVAYKRFLPAVFAEAEHAKARPGLYANGTLMGNGTYFSRFFFGYWPWATKVGAMMAWTYPSMPKRFPSNIGNQAEGGLDVKEGFLGSDGKPIPVIQWELAREGTDDFRYLVTLEHLIERLRDSKNDDTRRAVNEASAFLASLRASISRDVHRYTFEDPKTFEPMPSGEWDDTKFQATRKRSFELVKRLARLEEAPTRH